VNPVYDGVAYREQLLREVRQALCRLLQELLPQESDQWWEKLVLPHLTDLQRKILAAKQVTNLSGLDLAALLRIFVHNRQWIEERRPPLLNAYAYTFEVRAIRNKAAHTTEKDEIEADALARDLDTVARFLKALGAECPGGSAPDAARLEALLTRCEQDTRELFPRDDANSVADLLANWRKYRGDGKALRLYIQRLIRGPKRDNGRLLDSRGGLSLERIVIENSDLFTVEDVRIALETLAGRPDR